MLLHTTVSVNEESLKYKMNVSDVVIAKLGVCILSYLISYANRFRYYSCLVFTGCKCYHTINNARG